MITKNDAKNNKMAIQHENPLIAITKQSLVNPRAWICTVDQTLVHWYIHWWCYSWCHPYNIPINSSVHANLPKQLTTWWCSTHSMKLYLLVPMSNQLATQYYSFETILVCTIWILKSFTVCDMILETGSESQSPNRMAQRKHQQQAPVWKNNKGTFLLRNLVPGQQATVVNKEGNQNKSFFTKKNVPLVSTTKFY